MVTTQLRTTGKSNLKNSEILDRIVIQFEKKERIKRERRKRLEGIMRVMNFLVPIGMAVGRDVGAKTIAEVDELFFSSALLHQTWNFLQGTKLFPDFVDFSTDITVDPIKGESLGRNLTSIHQLALRKGGYERAVRKATGDLIRGEAFIYRDYEVNDKGQNVKLRWEHIPWQNIWQKYEDTDNIIVLDMTIDKYAQVYGIPMLKKVTTGGILPLTTVNSGDNIDFDNLTQAARQTERIQVIRYIDETQKIFTEVHGGNGHIFKDLQGDAFPFHDDDGTPSSPVLKRIFYEPYSGFHGWGPLDLMLPVAKLDTHITNATANRAILAADPLVVMATNEPDEAEKLWKKHIRNRSIGRTTPFFVSDTNSGTKITPQNVDVGVNNGNLDVWSKFLIQQATMRTGIDFRVLTEFAPTAEQQRLRKQEEDKVNISILIRNKEADKKFAKDDISFLKNTTSKFHNVEVWLEISEDQMSTLTKIQIDELKDKQGELPKLPIKINKFISSISNIEFDIAPRLEGVLDDQSFLDILVSKENLTLIPPGTKAHVKALTRHLQKTDPGSKIKEEDFVPIVPEAPIPIAG